MDDTIIDFAPPSQFTGILRGTYSDEVIASAESFLASEFQNPTTPIGDNHAYYLTHLLAIAERLALRLEAPEPNVRSPFEA